MISREYFTNFPNPLPSPLTRFLALRRKVDLIWLVSMDGWMGQEAPKCKGAASCKIIFKSQDDALGSLLLHLTYGARVQNRSVAVCRNTLSALGMEC